jgi:hypothetical protein
VPPAKQKQGLRRRHRNVPRATTKTAMPPRRNF